MCPLEGVLPRQKLPAVANYDASPLFILKTWVTNFHRLTVLGLGYEVSLRCTC